MESIEDWLEGDTKATVSPSLRAGTFRIAGHPFTVFFYPVAVAHRNKDNG
ncbi:MAG TPA: hypothetical protein PLM30_03585 [Synergistales bacterium]|nr:hypothetical protein [Synergistales bacterium]